MNEILNKIVSKNLKCLSQFAIKDCPVEITNPWIKNGPEFLSKQVICKCGNDSFYTYASSNEEMTLAPIELECSVCNNKLLIFNPTVHGWDGENGDSASLVGETEPVKINEEASQVIVNYSYQGIENYTDLLEEGVENPQDYFDVFGVFRRSSTNELTEVVLYECA